MARPFRSLTARTPRRASHPRADTAARLGGLGLWRIHLLGMHGQHATRALRRGQTAGGRGWHAILQAAADDSREDPEVLRITDEIHAAAPRLTTDDALCAYAWGARRSTHGPLGREFLTAMLAEVAEHPRDDAA
jgi:hypothetical protein